MIGTSAAAAAATARIVSPRRTTSALVVAAAQAPLYATRRYSSYQPPNPPKQEKSSTYANAQRAFYRDFGAPVAKVFLGALVTYQVLYWGWLKLESLETKDEKNDPEARQGLIDCWSGNTAEIASLEAQVRGLVTDQKKESK
ncbi:hypothetical protein B0J12DRAFT_735908 [Macrophomina phaseolina]|uniref:Uncharacterized protein n=1 Tax=Macrophomina phaseolina TaxID=35725 RepID=A0ABQ8GQA1_9PEZI|nr:hypothetical protein B0J12DRAFT_735908 [Macrophomina phaseolina]